MPNKAQMEIFDWLENLRAGGTVNMFMAPRMMEDHFGFTPEEAQTAFWEWTQHLKMEDDG